MYEGRARRRSSAVVLVLAAAASMVVPTAFAASASGRADAQFADSVPHAGAPHGAAALFPSQQPLARQLEGLDVSHWQGTIDFSQVKGAGYRFVIAKATEGQTFNDPNYATYRKDAKARRMYFGAYHFADPDTSTNDATIEADHFASVAAPVSGEIVPVLDIENSGGMSVSKLTTWVQTFLDRATADMGVKPMIYTGPYFWRTYMGDTTQFADEGYRNLWIANWGVPTPDVPANNWGGSGWTLWQYTNSGSVPGISGNVDLDHLAQGRLRRILIP